jgi:hypothetical protein
MGDLLIMVRGVLGVCESACSKDLWKQIHKDFTFHIRRPLCLKAESDG